MIGGLRYPCAHAEEAGMAGETTGRITGRTLFEKRVLPVPLSQKLLCLIELVGQSVLAPSSRGALDAGGGGWRYGGGNPLIKGYPPYPLPKTFMSCRISGVVSACPKLARRARCGWRGWRYGGGNPLIKGYPPHPFPKNFYALLDLVG